MNCTDLIKEGIGTIVVIIVIQMGFFGCSGFSNENAYRRSCKGSASLQNDIIEIQHNQYKKTVLRSKDLKEVKFTILNIEKTNIIEALRTRIIGVCPDNEVADLTLFAFHKSDEWPLIFERDKADNEIPIGMIEYAKNKTRFIKADRYPYEDRRILFPNSIRKSNQNKKDRPENWSGKIAIYSEKSEECLRNIEFNILFNDFDNNIVKIKGNIVINELEVGKIPWLGMFGDI
jgi:hypothetical protein